METKVLKEEKEFTSKLVDRFKTLVLKSMDQGLHKEIGDHFDFLEKCLEDLKEQEEK